MSINQTYKMYRKASLVDGNTCQKLLGFYLVRTIVMSIIHNFPKRFSCRIIISSSVAGGLLIIIALTLTVFSRYKKRIDKNKSMDILPLIYTPYIITYNQYYLSMIFSTLFVLGKKNLLVR